MACCMLATEDSLAVARFGTVDLGDVERSSQEQTDWQGISGDWLGRYA